MWTIIPFCCLVFDFALSVTLQASTYDKPANNKPAGRDEFEKCKQELAEDDHFPVRTLLGTTYKGKHDGEFKALSADCKLMYTCSCRNGQKHGTMTLYRPNGAVFAEIDYVHDVVHGRVVYYHENGKPKLIISYVDDKPNGSTNIYYHNGIIASMQQQDNGSLSGKQYLYDQLGNLIWTGEYSAGKLVASKSHSDDEKSIQEITEKSSKMLAAAKEEFRFKQLWKTTDSSKQTGGDSLNAEKAEVVRYEKLEKWITNHPELPPLKLEGELRNGQPHGEIKGISKDGKLVMVEEYRYGKKDGMVKAYYPNGKLFAETEYVNGIPHGLSLIYYDNGNLESGVIHVCGKPHGPSTKHYYTPNKQCRYMFRHEMGVFHGMQVEFLHNGDESKIELCLNGKLVDSKVLARPGVVDLEKQKEMDQRSVNRNLKHHWQ